MGGHVADEVEPLVGLLYTNPAALPPPILFPLLKHSAVFVSYALAIK